MVNSKNQQLPLYKELQKEMKIKNQDRLIYTVLGDRVIFIDDNFPYREKLLSLGINVKKIKNGKGYRLEIEDAMKLGLSLNYKAYELISDSRRNPIPLTTESSVYAKRLISSY